MAHATTFIPASTSDDTPGLFMRILIAMAKFGENDSRLRRVRALQALSDEELAKRGLQRDEIVQHVFGPYMY